LPDRGPAADFRRKTASAVEKLMNDSREEKFEIGQKILRLLFDVYAVTSDPVMHELPDLNSEIRRLAHSVSSNSHEGLYRRSAKVRARFVQVALDSCDELEGQLIRSRDLKLLTRVAQNRLKRKIRSIKKMLKSFLLTQEHKVEVQKI
jgi:four helix bundle protein